MPASRASRPPRRKPARDGTEPLLTVGDWLRFAVTSFTRAPLAFAQGLHGPQEEAMFLVGRFLGLEQADLPHFMSARLTRGEIRQLRELLRRRIDQRVPVPYLVNEAWYTGLRFYVDERVLIPRSYIGALLPDEVVRLGGRGWRPRRILDLGTGCGCLAIVAARAFPEALVDAVDLLPDALEVAAHNVSAHDLDDRVHLIQSDLFAALPSERYDLILANPPYEPADVIAQQPAELRHEPQLALAGGADGMACVRRILEAAPRHLPARGVLVLELGELRDAVMAEFPRLRHHVFALPDATEAVLGFRATDLAPPHRASRKASR